MTALDRMVCFSLYQASRATTQAYRRLLEPWGLTYPQYLVLVELWNRGPLSVRELGDDLALDSGTLSPLLRRMEHAELITRSREADDGRVVVVAPTPKGTSLREELAHIPAEIGTCMGLTLETADAMLAAVHRLTASVQTSNDSDAAPAVSAR